jgi:alpha-glucosidase/alpha-D-xyloside xylohydrolase
MHQQHVHKQDHHLRMRLYLEGQMQDSLNGRLLFGAYRGFQSHLNDTKRGAAARTAVLLILGLSAIGGVNALAQDNSFTLERDGRTIVLEPYAPNIIRVTLSKTKAEAAAAPGYGFVGTPSMTGWSHERDADGNDIFRSDRLVVNLSPDHLAPSLLPHGMPLDELNQSLRNQYFGHNTRRGPIDDTVSVTTASGKVLLTMRNWSMIPNPPETAVSNAATQEQNDPGSRVSATFDSPTDEHYYGLGQQQQGFLDLRDHQIKCWHDYSAIGGENVCVPFMVSSRGYGLIWDNPSKTTIDLGFNQRNVWSSQVGDRVSFFVIAGDNTDEIYEGYRQLTGVTHMLPRATYGYIQSKAIYPTQAQLLAVAKEYRERQLPLDVLVVDFLNMTRQGEMDLDPARWPDPAAMNDQLHSMGIKTLLSVWPHFAPGTRYYDMLRDKGWLVHSADGTPDSGGFKDVIGPNIDTTNPAAAKWFWETIRDRYIKPDHFDYIWLDETEPDIDPAKDFFYIGSGARYYNAYPLFHTASVYEGFRRDFGDSRRVMILARAAYLGAQRNGTVFWSSDITSTWDMLKRSIPAGLNFTATGMPYWDTDIAGFFSPSIPANYHAEHKPLIDPSDARDVVGNYEDYPELFVRWFEWGAFQPVMRAHGERMHNEVWAYGKQAEPILAKYLRLRYQLLPYTYSIAYKSYQTGAPFMRALFMDFPNDSNVADIPDEYMFGPAFLVAPVTEQGATHRKVYLPAGCDWYNYWTNERIKGGQTITANAPIDTIPLFVRAGSIVPLGSPIQSTQQKQAIASVRVYPGANASFTLFSDDGITYAYEKGVSSITRLYWNGGTHQFKHEGTAAWSGPDKAVVEIIGH